MYPDSFSVSYRPRQVDQGKAVSGPIEGDRSPAWAEGATIRVPTGCTFKWQRV